MAFALAEVGVWTSFSAFRIQSHLRKQTSESARALVPRSAAREAAAQVLSTLSGRHSVHRRNRTNL